MRKLLKSILILSIIFCIIPVHAATTGKIMGQVVDAETGEPLVGVNIIVIGEEGYGAATDSDGNYVIVNIPPDTYTVQASMIGYARLSKTGVEVNVDQTTIVDMEMRQATIQGEEIVVRAERNVVQRDVSTSVISVNAEEIERSIHTSVENLVGEQAGVQGLQVRGGQVNETKFMVDGVTARNPRNNNPITGISLSGIKDITVKRGGFQAEYGQVRSGIVNVVTKEGSRTDYSGTITINYNQPEPRYRDDSPYAYDSYFNKVYLDDNTAWKGTGILDEHTRNQFPDFEGWDKISERTLTDNDPDNDLTPLGAQMYYGWRHREEHNTELPDYNIDAGFGGPVPFVSDPLGDLRFYATFKRHRRALVFPLSTEDYYENNYHLKFTSNISSSMKLNFSIIGGNNIYNMDNWVYQAALVSDAAVAARSIGWTGGIFGTGFFSISDQTHNIISATLNHSLNSRTFYKVSLSRTHKTYRTHPPARRDTTRKYDIIPGFHPVDEAPFGWWPPENIYADEPNVMGFGGHVAKQRDTSDVNSYKLQADLTSQIHKNHQIKSGFEIEYTINDLYYGSVPLGSFSNYEYLVNRVDRPLLAAWYIQDKLETKGFVLNFGLRMDLFDPNTRWWDVGPWSELYTAQYDPDSSYNKKDANLTISWSPRLGISHPVTESTKLFFNYGHFQQLPAYERMYRVQRSVTGLMQEVGRPGLQLAKTVQYELGLDQSIMNQFLLRISAYYKDIYDQVTTIQYHGIGGIGYSKMANNSFEDIRGFEISLRKQRGRWFTMLANYTYQASSSGFFGRGQIYQDPSLQAEYDANTKLKYQSRPLPQPYARINLSLHTPANYGPEIMDIKVLGAWEARIFTDWYAVGHTTHNPNQVAGIINNVETPEYFNIDLRISKIFRYENFKFEVFANVFNALNTRRLAMHWGSPAGSAGDVTAYWQSLHLPESPAYDNIPGNDKYGSFRKPDVEYQPMRAISNRSDLENPDTRVVYYDRTEAVNGGYKWWQYNEQNGWQQVDKKNINQYLDEKAYIDMPNVSCFNFLDRRNITVGLKVSLEL
jgi:outer membrane receptor protein involved in Fe transport